MDNIKKLKAFLLAFCIFFSLLTTGNNVYAKSIYSDFKISLKFTEMTMYSNQTSPSLAVMISYSPDGYSDAELKKACEKINNDLMWTTSDASIVGFMVDERYDVDGNRSYKTAAKVSGPSTKLSALAEGTATITLKSSFLNQSYKCQVTVKNAELTCDDVMFYPDNSYTFSMKGNATGISYFSSNENVAVINKTTGVVKTKKKGTTTISCIADDGNTYTYKLDVKKSGLNYTKLTTYYYTGFKKGSYTYFPLVAEGIQVKSWKSSNKKVCKVNNLGKIGKLQMMGTGKCTITCTSKNGKKYKCKLTVVGGKKWGGLTGGYCPTISTVKKHGYFKDINSVLDYGDVIMVIKEYDNEIKLGNGNKRITEADLQKVRSTLQNRYPDKRVQFSFGDLLIFSSNNGKQHGRIGYEYYYVE